MGGVSQTIGADCSMVVCPVLCGASTSPECGGDCPGGQTCVETNPVAANALIPDCECVVEIAQGEACALQPQACAGDLPCEDGVCCNRVCGPQERCDLDGSEGVCTLVVLSLVPSPPMSNPGLILLVAILVGHRCVQLVRRRGRTGAL